MAKGVEWTQDKLEFFIGKALLTEDEEFIMRTRCKGYTVCRQAMELNKSESSIHASIKKIKRRYDMVQREYPEVLPIRRNSQKELYMDNH